LSRHNNAAGKTPGPATCPLASATAPHDPP
jgi:hypothetical protein